MDPNPTMDMVRSLLDKIANLEIEIDLLRDQNKHLCRIADGWRNFALKEPFHEDDPEA